MLNIISHLWNANRKHSEMPLHTNLGSYDEKDR